MNDVNRQLLPEPLLEWIERTLDGEIVRIRPRAGGGAVRSGAEVDIQRRNGHLERGFLAYDGGQRMIPGARAKHLREASLLRALEETDIRAPRLLASDADLRAHLFEFVPGDDRFAHLTKPERATAIANDFIGELARLHNLDARSLPLEGFGPIEPPRLTITRRIKALHAEHTAAGPADPFIVYGLRWLERNVPAYDGPAVVVHGDAGPGNFLFDDFGLKVVLDWELAHYSDPMEDFAWMSIRAIIQAWVPFPPLLDEYQRRSGIPVDLERIRFYRIYTLLGMMVGSHRRFFQEPHKLADQGRLGGGLMFATVHRRAYVHGLADAMGLELPAVSLPDAAPTAIEPFMDSVLKQIRDLIVGRTDDQVIAETAKDAARVLKYVVLRQRLEAVLAGDEVDDLAGVLGHRPPDLASGRAELVDRIRADAVDDTTMIDVLWRRASRETAMMRDSLGALAQRLFPPLTDG
jgi:aminoglycoside phosphotransferase (APT) family kinase protein